MKRSALITIISIMLFLNCVVLAQELPFEQRTMRDSNNNPYTIHIYYEPYDGLRTSTRVVVAARRYTMVKDMRTETTSSNFTSGQRADMHRMMHSLNYLDDSNHVGNASIKYNCFAYAYQVTNCWILPPGIETLITEGDLIEKDDVRDADIAIHLGEGFFARPEHASRVSGEGIPPISCKGTVAPLENDGGKQDILVYYYRGKFGHGCIHKTGLDAVNAIYATAGVRYYVKKSSKAIHNTP